MMSWTQHAENAIKKVPLFVRKKVRTRVESQVAAANKNVVTLADVKTAQQRYIQSMNAEMKGYQIDIQACMSCGKCIGVCPTETIGEQERGFRIQLGGKLGRHPQLARELPEIYSQGQVLDIINYCIIFYKRASRGGKRFAQIFGPSDFDDLVDWLEVNSA